MKKLLLLVFLTPYLFTHEVHIWDAKNYHENSLSQKKTSDYLLSKFKFNGDEKILDLGCGDGKISSLISSYIPQGNLLGLDLSKNMITFAKEKYASNNLAFDLGNACTLNYENEFDIIFSFTALQWAEDHEKVLLGMRKALKPNGTVAIAMPMGFPLTMEQAIEEMTHHEKWRSYFNDFSTGYNFVSLNGYKLLLEKAGFEINLIEKRGQKDIFENKKAFSQFISQWFPYLRPIPKEHKEEFMSSFLDRYFELEEIDPNGEVYFNPNHLIVIAHKR